MSDVSGLIVPQLCPNSYVGNIRRLKPVNPFANQHDHDGSEYGELRSDEDL
jgi:hypothetical protein